MRDAIQQFLHGAPQRTDLLAEAGIGAAELGKLRDYDARLAAVEAQRDTRRSGKEEVTAAIRLHSLALESYFNVFRARVRSRLRGDHEALTRVLSQLPRLPERRRTTAKEAPAPPATNTATGG